MGTPTNGNSGTLDGDTHPFDGDTHPFDGDTHPLIGTPTLDGDTHEWQQWGTHRERPHTGRFREGRHDNFPT